MDGPRDAIHRRRIRYANARRNPKGLVILKEETRIMLLIGLNVFLAVQAALLAATIIAMVVTR